MTFKDFIPGHGQVVAIAHLACQSRLTPRLTCIKIKMAVRAAISQGNSQKSSKSHHLLKPAHKIVMTVTAVAFSN